MKLMARFEGDCKSYSLNLKGSLIIRLAKTINSERLFRSSEIIPHVLLPQSFNIFIVSGLLKLRRIYYFTFWYIFLTYEVKFLQFRYIILNSWLINVSCYTMGEGRCHNVKYGCLKCLSTFVRYLQKSKSDLNKDSKFE